RELSFEMGRYIIRTERNKTELLIIVGRTESLGVIDYDFILRDEKLPLHALVKTPQGIAGYVETFYPSERSIRVYDKRREEVAYLGKSDTLRIDGVYISLTKLSKEETISREEREKGKKLTEKLERLGLTHSYWLDDLEFKGKVYCFTRKNEISTLVSVNTGIKPGVEELLRLLPLAISRRISEQEFIRRFIAF
ncbi:MAG: hypothetical protein ACE5HR_09900, partial [bacterium]